MIIKTKRADKKKELEENVWMKYRVIYILVRVLVYRYHALVGGVNVGLSSFLSLSLDFFASLFPRFSLCSETNFSQFQFCC